MHILLDTLTFLPSEESFPSEITFLRKLDTSFTSHLKDSDNIRVSQENRIGITCLRIHKVFVLSQSRHIHMHHSYSVTEKIDCLIRYSLIETAKFCHCLCIVEEDLSISVDRSIVRRTVCTVRVSAVSISSHSPFCDMVTGTCT